MFGFLYSKKLNIWSKPDGGWLKLNIGCTRFGQNGRMNVGVLSGTSLEHGDWVHNSVANIGTGQILKAEMWGGV